MQRRRVIVGCTQQSVGGSTGLGLMHEEPEAGEAAAPGQVRGVA